MLNNSQSSYRQVLRSKQRVMMMMMMIKDRFTGSRYMIDCQLLLLLQELRE